MSRKISGTNPAVAPKSGKDLLFKTSADFPDVVEIDVDQIDPNPFQPRKAFDEAGIAALAASIEDNGLQQPVGVVAAAGGRYTLVWGERRLRAVKRIGRDTIFAILTKVSPEDAGEIALIENTQRSDLTCFELADAIDGLRKKHGHSHEAIARLIGKSRPYVTKTLSLLNLPESARAEWAGLEEKPTWTQMVAIAAIEDAAERAAAWERCIGRLNQSYSDVGGQAEEDQPRVPDAGRQERTSEEALSALSIRNAHNLLRSRDVLRSLAEKPKPLMDSDRAMLEDMRDAIERILQRARSAASA